MIIPTQAHEAAVKAIEAATISLKDFSKWSEVAATAALTAAAEVDKSELEKQYDHNADLDREIERLRSELAALTAAAQVGEQHIMQQTADVAQMDIAGRLTVAIKRIAILEKEEAATIERCAQVAEQWAGQRIKGFSKTPEMRTAEAIAAAIRALKDK